MPPAPRAALHLALPALLAAGLALVPPAARAASCCGGGGSGASVLGRSDRAMLDAGFELERYDGFWDLDGKHKPDPPGSDLRQYRVNLTGAVRLGAAWQAGVTVPWVWNSNVYSGTSSHTSGPGDATLSLWWEPLTERSAWKLTTAADWVPNVTTGLSATIPTGISPYDDVKNSFDVTGRGFYRLDANLNVDKGYRAWTAAVALAWGVALERPVNRLYGAWVEPYHKKLGNRASATGSLAYRHVLGTAGDSLAGALALAWLHEAQGTIDGAADPTTGLSKTSVAGTLTWSSTDDGWQVRGSWSHAFQRDGWGKNFPTTDIFSLGVRYAFR